MEKSASKRPLSSNQSVGRLAVCSKCCRVSNNPQVCDSCGHSLSEDNAAAVYTSETKRTRTAVQDPPVANGINNHHSSSSTPSVQAHGTSVRPQALYVNLNNQAFPVIGVGEGGARMPRTQNDLASIPSMIGPTSGPHLMQNMSGMPTSMMTNMMTPMQAANLMNMPPNGQPRPPPPLTSMHPQVSLPGFNLQPPPSYLPTNSTRNSRSTAVPQASTSSSSSTGAAANQEPGTATLTNVPAYQIRIGSRKFIPVSTVQFKEDGVLFTLRNFTFAPVLLNARAIIRCRANLRNVFPVIMLYLEGSCMRQIRSIFELSEKEFSEASPVDLRRCITIFPQFEPENKCNLTRMIKGIAQSFDRMVQKYPRSNAILDLISSNEAIDLVTGSCIDEEEPSAATSMPSAVTQAPPPNVSLSTAPANIAMAARFAPPQMTSAPTNAPIAPAPAPLTPRGAAPMLRMPSDDAVWQQMQKNLVTGGVYHVLTPDGHRKYCLWSGKQLVPCHVQNMEVQMKTRHACFGCLQVSKPVVVRVKTDHPSGIYFSCKAWRQTKVLYVPVEDMLHCKKSTVDGFCSLFIRPSEQCVSQFATILGTKEGPSKWFISMILEDLSSEQKDALMQMKRGGANGRPIFETLSVPTAFGLYAELTNNKRVMGFVSKQQSDGTMLTDSFVARVCAALMEGEGETSFSNTAPLPVATDDDDDVVMTSEEVGVKCPYTQAVMKEPIRNKICNHNYEKMAIHEFILRKKGTAKCPYAGCGNVKPLSLVDLEDNHGLKEYIEKLKPS